MLSHSWLLESHRTATSSSGRPAGRYAIPLLTSRICFNPACGRPQGRGENCLGWDSTFGWMAAEGLGRFGLAGPSKDLSVLSFFFGPTEPFDSNDRRHVYGQVLQRHASAHADATARQAAAGWPSCPFSSPPSSGPKIKHSHPPALCQHVAYVSASATSLCPFPTCPPVPLPSCRRQLSFSPSHGRARRQKGRKLPSPTQSYTSTSRRLGSNPRL